MTKKNLLIKGGYLFLILLFPSLFYIILSTGKHGVITLPYLGPKTTVVAEDGEIDSIPYTVPNISLQAAYEGAFEELNGKIKVLNFVYNNCDAACDRSMAQLLSFTDKFEKYKDIWNATIVLDEVAAENVLDDKFKNYISKRDKWLLLYTNDNNQILKINNYILNQIPDTNKAAQMIVILDKQNAIRAAYDGTQYTDYSEIVDAVKVLKAEEFISKKR